MAPKPQRRREPLPQQGVRGADQDAEVLAVAHRMFRIR
jgi:hypothetical protein